MKLDIQMFGGRGASSSISKGGGNKSKDYKIRSYSTDAYSGQVNMVKEIRNDNDEVIAKLQYTDYNDTAYIDLIETKQGYKNQGLATKLMDDLEKEYGDNIDWGYTTPAGTLFKKAYEQRKRQNKRKQKLLTEEEFIALFKTKK